MIKLLNNYTTDSKNIIAITNSGIDAEKSIIKPNVLAADSNYVFVHNSPELLSTVGGYLSLQGYNVKVLDLIDFNHHTYNPFTYSSKNTTFIAKVLSESITKEDKQFKYETFLLLDAVITHMYSDTGQQCSLKYILELIDMLEDIPDLSQFLQEEPLDFEAVIKYEKFNTYTIHTKNAKEVFAYCKEKLEFLYEPEFIFTTASSSVNLPNINKEKYALFIMTPEDGHLNFLSSILLSQLAFIIDGNIPVTIFSNNFSDFIFPKKVKQDFNFILSTDSVNKHVNKIKKFETIYLDGKNIGYILENYDITEAELIGKKKNFLFAFNDKGEKKYGKKLNADRRREYAMSYEEFEKEKREFKGVFVKEILLQFNLRNDIDPEKIKQVASYVDFEWLPDREEIIADAYNTAKKLFFSRDLNTLVSYIIRTCDCREEIANSKTVILVDDDGCMDEESVHLWYMLLIKCLEGKIVIADPGCNFYPEILRFVIYHLTLDKNITYSSLYQYFYAEDNSNVIQYEYTDGSGDMAFMQEEQGPDFLPTNLNTIEDNNDNSNETGFNEEKVNECLAELDSLIGLEKEKAVIKEIVNIVLGNKLREQSGNKPFFSDSFNFHILFTGNPGTGKTTVARIYSKILRHAGVLSTGGLFECSKSDLIGGYLGQTPMKTKAVLEKAKGGVLFIDEAYSLVGDDKDQYGSECIATLVQYMESMKNIAIVLAGYSEPMEKFMKSNPGLRSRIYNVIEFKDYTFDELVQIFDKMSSERGFIISDDVKEKIKEKITLGMKNKDFGNARGIRNFVDILTKSLLYRISNDKITDPIEQNTITEVDVEKIVVKEEKQKRTIGFC